MNGAGDDAQVRYAAALDALRGEPEQSVLALAQAEAVCNRTDYPLRWALVYAAAQMNHDAALPYLRNLILTPIPPEQSSAPHSFSTVGKETVLRTTAIEGVGRLAVQGNEAALPALFEFLSIASISVRRASVQAILAVNPKLRKKAAEALPADHRFLLDIVPKDVREVPQVQNPKKHLPDKKPANKPKPPAMTDGQYKGGTSNPGPKLGK